MGFHRMQDHIREDDDDFRGQAALLLAQNARAQFEANQARNAFPATLFNQQLGFATGGMNQLGQSIAQQFAAVNAANQKASLGIRAINAGSPVEQARINQEGATDRANLIFGEGGALSGLFGGVGGGGVPSFSGPDGQFVGPGQFTTGISPAPNLNPQLQGGLDALQNARGATLPQASGIGQAPGGQTALQSQLAQLMGQGARSGASDFDRLTSQSQAAQDLASQTARANAGVRGGNLFARLRQQPIREGVARGTAALRFAGSVA